MEKSEKLSILNAGDSVTLTDCWGNKTVVKVPTFTKKVGKISGVQPVKSFDNVYFV